METEAVVEALKPWRDSYFQEAWKPLTAAGDPGATAAKFGGTPWLAPDERWPRCETCGAALAFLLQLDLDALPAQLDDSYGTGLLQLFHCTTCWSGSAPFSDASVVRVVAPGGAASAAPPDDAVLFPPCAIVGWDFFLDYPNREEQEELGLRYDYNFTRRGTQIAIACPPLQIDVRDLTDEQVDHATGGPAAGDKLGGWPHWGQGVDYPHCPQCDEEMDLVFQIDSFDNLPVAFGDAGIGHVTHCPTHKHIVAFGWAGA